MLVVSAVVAGLMAAARMWRKRRAADSQFLYDMLGVWTVIELLLIVGADLDPTVTGVPMPNVVELIHSNGALLPFALLYCAWAVGRSTVEPTLTALRSRDKAE